MNPARPLPQPYGIGGTDGASGEVTLAPSGPAQLLEGDRAERLGVGVERQDDGSVLLRRLAPAAAQLYLAVDPAPAGGTAPVVRWATDLARLVHARRDAGIAPQPHHGTVLAYLRGDDTATGRLTFFQGIQRLDAHDEVRVLPDGTLQRRRGDDQPGSGAASARPAAPAALADAVTDAVAAIGPADVLLLAEDDASTALAGRVAARRAVSVRAASTRSADAAREDLGRSRVSTLVQRGGLDLEDVRPTTEQFKKDLPDLIRSQVEPFEVFGVYAHYCAVRAAARLAPEGVVVDATGPIGAGLVGTSRLQAGSPGVVGPRRERSGDALVGRVTDRAAGLAHRVRQARRMLVEADALLDPRFVTGTAATGHRPEELGRDRDTGAVVAAARSAVRFRVHLRMPLLDPAVRTAAGQDGLASYAALVDPALATARYERTAAIDAEEWTGRLKGLLHQVFRSASFAGRPWVVQRDVLDAFDSLVARRLTGIEVFWRLFVLELWMRTWIDADPREAAGPAAGVDGGVETTDGITDWDGEDDHGRSHEPEPKEPLTPNEGKQLDLELTDREGGRIARRYPLRTAKFSADSRLVEDVVPYVTGFFADLDAALAADGSTAADHREATEGRSWNLTISEKIIAIMQGRSYFVWDVKPSWWARQLSRFVSRTPAGIGLGDPVTMHLAIQEAGLPRVLLASAAGAAGKLVRRRGLFYQVVGGNVRAIDGPTEYSVYPANVSAKLPPKDPDRVAEQLNEAIRAALPERWARTFTGTVVMDANDIGRNTLGKAAPLSGAHYEGQFADNPLGQGREQTPMAVVFERP
ncbi:hypothetical protein JSY14_05415 [Brachybacterium sp. EF45031]|uniref:hypothetical protein n=1 Tax=Brachybacterium sillae TaxID=2810536 RepID=UPI00217D7788|nr:hypothetical protein [Brachybacterium sillae]MCS6711490.1 hypothetical protein [Brachybacterium sillae]